VPQQESGGGGGGTDSPATCSRPHFFELVTKGQSNGIKMGDKKRSKFQTSRFMNFENPLYFCLWVISCHCTDRFWIFYFCISGDD
jgi:hypothetical protein